MASVPLPGVKQGSQESGHLYIITSILTISYPHWKNSHTHACGRLGYMVSVDLFFTNCMCLFWGVDELTSLWLSRPRQMENYAHKLAQSPQGDVSMQKKKPLQIWASIHFPKTGVYCVRHCSVFLASIQDSQHTQSLVWLIHAHQKTSHSLRLLNYWCVFGWDK